LPKNVETQQGSRKFLGMLKNFQLTPACVSCVAHAFRWRYT